MLVESNAWNGYPDRKNKKSNALEFTLSAIGGENDWALVIDDASEHFEEPGKRK